MGVCQTLGFIPQGIQFFLTDGTDLHNRGRFINTYPFLEDRNQKLPDGEGVFVDFGFFPGFLGVKDDHIFGCAESFANQADQISTDFSGLFVVDPINGFVAGIGNFFCVFGQLDLGDEFAGVFIQNSSQLVDTAESRAVLGSDQIGANTPGSNLSTLGL